MKNLNTSKRNIILLLISLLLFNCEQVAQAPGNPPISQLNIQARFLSNLGLVAIDITAPPLENGQWIGYEVYMTNDITLLEFDSSYVVRHDVNTPFTQGQAQTITISPGYTIGERLIAISLIYKLESGQVKQSVISNMVKVVISQRSSLGCKTITQTSSPFVEFCIDTSGVSKEGKNEGKNIFARWKIIEKQDNEKSIAELEKTYFSGDIPSAKIKRDIGSRYLLDSIKYTYNDLISDDLGVLRLFVLVQYQVNSVGGGKNIISEKTSIKYNNNIPTISFIPKVESGTYNILQPSGTGDLYSAVPRTMVNEKKIRFTIPPNSPIKEEFKFRLLYPLQASVDITSAYGRSDAKRSMDRGSFLYISQLSPKDVIPDTNYKNLLQPGGWVAMQWHEGVKSEADISLDVEKYVAEFNSLPPENRVWEAYSDTLRKTIVKDSVKIGDSSFQVNTTVQSIDPIAKGNFNFVYDKYKEARILLSIDTLQDSVRKVDSLFPYYKPMHPLWPKASGYNNINVVDNSWDGRNLNIPFFQMPAFWGAQRRSRNFIIEFEFKGENFGDAEPIRKAYSILPTLGSNAGDLFFGVAAPSIKEWKVEIPSERISRGAEAFEGIVDSKPVNRNIRYSVTINSNYWAFELDGAAYAARIPEFIKGTVSTDAQYITPMKVAFSQGNFTKCDSIGFQILHDLYKDKANREITTISKAKTLSIQPKEKVTPTRGMDFRFDTKNWLTGIYIVWMASGDRDFVSGPLLDEDAGIPGPAFSYEQAFNPKATVTKDGYKLSANPRIFSFSREQ